MDNQQTPTAGSPIYQESQSKNAKWLWLLVILIIIGALVFAYVRGIGPFGQLSFLSKKEPSPTPVSFYSPPPATSESSPSASEESLDKTQVVLRVLNGSGKAGKASSVKDFLEGKGWKVTSIGNADNYDYQSTILRFKEKFRN